MCLLVIAAFRALFPAILQGKKRIEKERGTVSRTLLDKRCIAGKQAGWGITKIVFGRTNGVVVTALRG